MNKIEDKMDNLIEEIQSRITSSADKVFTRLYENITSKNKTWKIEGRVNMEVSDGNT